jgi:hypothetical protein
MTDKSKLDVTLRAPSDEEFAAMGNLFKLTDEEFDEMLRQIIDEEYCAEDLLKIPGIDEILSEHFSAEIVTRWEEKMDNEFFMLTGKSI